VDLSTARGFDHAQASVGFLMVSLQEKKRRMRARLCPCAALSPAARERFVRERAEALSASPMTLMQNLI
jgi:hypothetical protein